MYSMNNGNILEYKLDSGNIILSDTSFSYQTLCIHHDNFHRLKSFVNIGENGDKKSPMPYTKYGDTTIDDGFRIQNNKLINERNCESSLGIRLVDKDCGNIFFTEISYPEETNTYQTVVFQNDNNKGTFMFIDVYLDKSGRVNFQKGLLSNGKSMNVKVVKKTRAFGNDIKYLINKGKLSIYIDDNIIYEEEEFLNVSPKTLGIMIARKRDYSYKMFNIFRITSLHHVSPVNLIDKGQIDNDLTRSKDKEANAYSHTSEATIVKSGLSERFELRYDDATIKTSPRSEVTVIPIERNNLRRFIISFDVFIPQNYEIDEYYDVLMQVHDSPADNRINYGLNPNIALRIKGNSWFVTTNGEPDTGNLSSKKYTYSSINYLGNIRKGYWTHFDFYVKEGYMPEQNPLLIIKMDGKSVFKSSSPNCYNNPRGSYFKYGIYKADWKKGNIGSAKKRIVYFDNFTYTL